jgi:tetratricopeptide (TPR) repeat protein
MKYATILLMLALTTTGTALSEDYMASKWNHTTKEIISGLTVADLNGDGRGEVLVATSQEGAVYALNGRGSEFWSKPYRMGGYVFELSSADLDSDGRGEVIAGYGSHAIAVSSEGVELWKYSTSRNHVQAIDEEDLNGDGKKDVVVAAYKKDECKNAVIYAINPAVYPPDTIWKHTIKGYDLPVTLDAADIDGDGKGEVIVGLIYRAKSSVKASCNANIELASKVTAFSSSGDVIWEFTTPGGVTWVKADDLDGDGKKEILVSSRPYIYALNEYGQPVWEYELNDAAGTGLVVDLDDDGKKEVVLAVSDVVVLDSAGKFKWIGPTGSRVYSLTAGDVDNNGFPEIVAGSNKVYIFDRDGKLKWESPHFVSVDYVHAVDMDSDEYAEVVAGAVKTVHYFKTQEYAKKLRAEELYRKGLAYKNVKNIEMAVECLNQSKELYRQLGITSGVTACINELQNLYTVGEQVDALRGEADSYLNLSKHAYINSDFVNASRYAQVARSKYSAPQINDRLAVDECNRIINNSNAIIVLNASDAYRNALRHYNESRLQEALEDARTAEQLYRVTGNRGKAELASMLAANLSRILGIDEEGGKSGGRELGWVSRIRGLVDRLNTTYVIATITIAGIVVIMSFIAAVLWKRIRTPRLKLGKPARRRKKKIKRKKPVTLPEPRERKVLKTGQRRAGHGITDRMNYHKKKGKYYKK